METVIVERVFAEPIALSDVEQRMSLEHGCFTSRRVTLVRSCVSRDGKRMICVYQAPDAESVRVANQLAGAPFERVWTADVLEAEAYAGR
ncbi:MAG: nickel-binding protein [Polyangiales bacterium]